MRYLQSYRFLFTSPNWLTNLLLASVCSLIPVIGPIVLIGYLFEVIDVLLRRRAVERLRETSRSTEAFGERVMDALPADDDEEADAYPDFSFSRFGDYLVRGVWPFLARLIVGMMVGIPAVVLLIVGIVMGSVASAAANSTPVLVAVYAAFWIVYLFLMLIVGVLTTPLYLRAGLSADLGSAFSWTFYRDFMKRAGKQVVLVELFLGFTAALLFVVGLLMCYVGIFPALALIQYAHHHLEYQLYELYLERGGEPVERKEKPLGHYAEDQSSSLPAKRPRTDDRSTDIRRSDEEW
jgi:hypothetical protein